MDCTRGWGKVIHMKRRSSWAGNTPQPAGVVTDDMADDIELLALDHQEDPTTITLTAPATTSHAAPVTSPLNAAPVTMSHVAPMGDLDWVEPSEELQ